MGMMSLLVYYHAKVNEWNGRQATKTFLEEIHTYLVEAQSTIYLFHELHNE
jgi:hypothetical protein